MLPSYPDRHNHVKCEKCTFECRSLTSCLETTEGFASQGLLRIIPVMYKIAGEPGAANSRAKRYDG